jgi:hypothetical protein
VNDVETREALIALCEAVKSEFRHLYALHSALTRMFQALKEEVPGLENRYRQQGFLIEASPELREQLERVDALLQQLKKV